MLVILAFSSQAQAKDKDNAGVTQLVSAPTQLKNDMAYILLRTSTAKTGLFTLQPVFLRIPNEEELADYQKAKKAAYEKALPDLQKKAQNNQVPTIEQFSFDYEGKANSFVASSKEFLTDGNMRTILLEVPIGKYILYGSTNMSNTLVTCNCLGTVGFEVKAGIITDMGSVYTDKVHKKSPLPHLEDNLGPSMFNYGYIFGQALVPVAEDVVYPDFLKALPIEPARFEVIKQYYEPGAASINRLAPISGLLGYKRGKPVDLRVAE
ncbi:MAG: hypothetical protein HC843_07565 [Sphingomonadales bacterium]|nr:hypothetical protein [Sphingomonadales bacterium]